LKTSRLAVTVKSTPHGFRTFNGAARETWRTFSLFFNGLTRNILPGARKFLPHEPGERYEYSWHRTSWRLNSQRLGSAKRQEPLS
jgi:hypothetical protein